MFHHMGAPTQPTCAVLADPAYTAVEGALTATTAAALTVQAGAMATVVASDVQSETSSETPAELQAARILFDESK